MIYYMIPKLFGRQMFSVRLMNYHFWLGLSGILIYYISMWASGITQGLMWKAVDDSGYLVYPDFVETVMTVVPLYWVRAVGGSLYIAGYLFGVYNIVKTVKGANAPADEVVQVVVKKEVVKPKDHEEGWHRKLEGMVGVFSVLAFIAVLIGSVIEIWPTLNIHKYVPQSEAVLPYTALEQAGRDIYVTEGCYVCHSQMIRKHPSDVLRFGEASTLLRACMTGLFSGGPSEQVPTWLVLVRSIPTYGTTAIWTTRGAWWRNPLCLATHGY
jgi:cytochrome c oxidase cbb3-type subunit I/II